MHYYGASEGLLLRGHEHLRRWDHGRQVRLFITASIDEASEDSVSRVRLDGQDSAGVRQVATQDAEQRAWSIAARAGTRWARRTSQAATRARPVDRTEKPAPAAIERGREKEPQSNRKLSGKSVMYPVRNPAADRRRKLVDHDATL